MKTLLLTSLLMLAASVQARSILTFKPVLNCATYSADKARGTVEVSEAQDGQARLVITLKGETKKITAYGKKVLPPRMMAGAPTRYTGKDAESNLEAELSVGMRPVKVGKKTGRAANLELIGKTDLALICTAVTK